MPKITRYPEFQTVQADTYEAMVDLLRDVATMIVKDGDSISVDAMRVKKSQARLILYALEHPRPPKLTQPDR